MKSDREFLDGIYEKAKIYEEQNKKTSTFQKGYHSLKPIYLAAIVVLFVTAGAILYEQPWRGQQQLQQPSQELIMEPMGEDMPQKVRGIPFSAVSEIVLEEAITEGKVLTISQEERALYIIPSHIYAGDLTETEVLKVVIGEDIPLENSFIDGEQVLLYLQQTEEGTWQLAEGLSSKYAFVEEEGTVRYFENGEGNQVNTSQLIAQE